MRASPEVACLPAPQFRTFGVPSLNAGDQRAFTATYDSGAGLRPAVLGPSAETTKVLVNAGQFAPDATGTISSDVVFATFKDVLLNDAGSIAFLGTLRQRGAVTARNDAGIWTNAGGGTLQLVAREGARAPGLSSTFKSFVSLALSPPFSRVGDAATRVNLAFVARLQGNGVTSQNDRSLWIYEFPRRVCIR